MKNLDQLLNQSSVLPVYLISGEEPLLVIEAQDHVRSVCQKAGFEERKKLTVDKKFDWNSLTDEAMNLSLFADKKLIELNLQSAAGREGSKVISEFVKANHPDLCLMIHAPKLDRNQEKAAWVKAIEQHGLAIKIWPIKPQQMHQWVAQRARQMQLMIQEDGLQAIASYCEGNLLSAKQVLQKLQIAEQDQPFSVDEVMQFLTNDARYNPYELFNSALNKPAQAQRMLKNFRLEGVQPYPILWSLINELKPLVHIKTQMQRGQSFHEASASLRLWPSRKNMLETAIHTYSLRQLNALMRRAEKMDATVKGAFPDDIWRQLSEWVLLLGRHRIPKR